MLIDETFVLKANLNDIFSGRLNRLREILRFNFESFVPYFLQNLTGRCIKIVTHICCRLVYVKRRLKTTQIKTFGKNLASSFFRIDQERCLQISIGYGDSRLRGHYASVRVSNLSNVCVLACLLFRLWECLTFRRRNFLLNFSTPCI